MADKKPTDEELAQRIIEKLAARERESFNSKMMAQPGAAESRQFHGQLDDSAYLPEGKPPVSGVKVEAQEPTQTVWVHKPDSPEAKAAAQASREGVVYLQNTERDGTKTKGAMIARKMFKTDEDFDKFVARAKEQDNLWNPEAESSGNGGSIYDRVRKAGNALFGPQAVPSGAGGGSGSNDDGSSLPARKAAPTGQAVTREGAPAPAAPVEESYMYANGPSARPPGFFSGGAGGGGGTNPPPDQPVSGPSGNVLPGEPSLPMANGGNNVLSVPGYAAGSLFAGGAPAPAQQTNDPTKAGYIPFGQGPNDQLGGSASASVRGPMLGAPAVPREPTHDAEMQKAADLATQAIGHSAEITAAQQKAEADIYDNEQKQQAEIAQKMQGQLEYVQQGQKSMMDSIAKAQELLNSPAKTPDPERYWKNHSKIMFAIGVGFLAQAGKDINGVLNNVNNAIDRDVEQQKAEFEAPRAAARGKIAAAQQMYGLFRDQGHDAYEAAKMAQIVLKDRTATEIAKVMANSNSEQAVFNGQKMQAQVQEGLAKDLNDLSVHRQTSNVAEYNARTNRMKANVKAQVAATKGKGGGKLIPEGGVNAISKLKTAMSSLDELSSHFQRVGGSPGDAILNNLREKLPRTDATNYNKMRDAFMRTIGLLVDESVIQKHDADAWEKLLPRSSDMNGAASLRALMQSVQMKLNDRIKTFGEAGYDVSRISSPTQAPTGGNMVKLKSGEVVERVP